ncbi:MAG TPA: hypothetical protein DIC34_07705 [Treponema sp.]|nr:MAG: hypothetical protein A2413_11580 [Treponema sp. RIFOXYC1_FULL_61_9]HCM26409.1 hypothetical protein [Treponema sp.]
MRKGTVPAVLAAAIAMFASPTSSAEEKTVRIGGASNWADVVRRDGVAEISGSRRYPALVLSSALPAGGDADLSLSFDAPSAAEFADSSGRYRVSASPSVSVAGALRARSGSGAALFTGSSSSGDPSGITALPSRGALLSPGTRLADFSIEFWLFPANMENGEQILSWTASRRSPSGESSFQRVRCLVVRNRLEWTFADFFASPDEGRRLMLSLASRASIVPRAWSHHLIRFDSVTGMLEYLVDGATASVAYATESGREGGEVYAPVAGSGGTLVIAPRYAGLVDEFRILGRFQDRPGLARFPARGGRAETRFLDLGTTNAELLGIDAKVGSDGASSTAEVRLFARGGDSPYGWSDDEETWIPVASGAPLGGRIRGRWIQVAAVLYPDGDGEITPVLEELVLRYATDDPPPPPSLVVAVAAEGAVDLRWRASPDADLGGYLIYFGERKGEYFGESTTAGPSPLDVGNRTSLRIDGLTDGTLYWFAVAAYDRALPRHIGEFSREVAARPARTVR